MIRLKFLPYLLQWCGAALLGKAVAIAYLAGGWGLGFLAFLMIAVMVEILGGLLLALRDHGED